MTFGGVQGAFEQGAEDGGFDIGPILMGGIDEEIELVGGEFEGLGIGEEAAVEAEEVFAEDGGEAAFVHVLPDGHGHGGEFVGGVLEAFEEGGEGVVGDEVDIFCEESEQDAHEEVGDGFGVMAGFFERFGKFGEGGGDFSRDFGRTFGGVEGLGIGPDFLEAVEQVGTALRIGEVFEVDAVGEVVGEGGVGFSEAGEVGIGFNGVADIYDEQEGGIVIGDIADVGFGLGLGAEHGIVPDFGAAGAVTFFEATGLCGRHVGFGRGGLFFDALFGFQDEVAAMVEVDEIGGGGTIGMGHGDGAVENVAVFGLIGSGGIGVGDLKEVAEFREEKLVVCAFGTACGLPSGEECGKIRCRLGHVGIVLREGRRGKPWLMKLSERSSEEED